MSQVATTDSTPTEDTGAGTFDDFIARLTLRDAAVGVVVLLLAILLLSIGVGFWAAGGHPTTAHVETEDGATVTLEQPSGHETFDAEVAAIFGTAVGTTLLALVTGLLAIGTWKDVRASQAMVKLTRDEHAARTRPVVIGGVEKVTYTGRQDDRLFNVSARVALSNVGGGPAVGLEVAVYWKGRAFGDILMPKPVHRRALPAGAEDMFVDVVMKGDMLMSDFDEKLLEVTGTYRDWLNMPAGPIIDWTKSPTIRPPAAGAVAGAGPDVEIDDGSIQIF